MDLKISIFCLKYCSMLDLCLKDIAILEKGCTCSLSGEKARKNHENLEQSTPQVRRLSNAERQL